MHESRPSRQSTHAAAGKAVYDTLPVGRSPWRSDRTQCFSQASTGRRLTVSDPDELISVYKAANATEAHLIRQSAAGGRRERHGGRRA